MRGEHRQDRGHQNKAKDARSGRYITGRDTEDGRHECD